MPRLPLLLCALTLFCIGPRHASAQEQIFTDANCAFTPPDGWHSTMETMPPQPGLLAAFGNAEDTRFLVLIVQGRGQVSAPLDARIIVDIERDIREHSGGERIRGTVIRTTGPPVYERLGTVEAGGKHLSILARATPTGEGVYLLDAIRTDGDADDAPELRQTLASFRFLHPPAPTKTRSRRLGELCGGIFCCVLILGTIVLTIRAITARYPSPRPAPDETDRTPPPPG